MYWMSMQGINSAFYSTFLFVCEAFSVPASEQMTVLLLGGNSHGLTAEETKLVL